MIINKGIRLVPNKANNKQSKLKELKINKVLMKIPKVSNLKFTKYKIQHNILQHQHQIVINMKKRMVAATKMALKMLMALKNLIWTI